MKRKLLTIILMVTLSITSLTACGHEDNNKENKEKIIFDTFIVEEKGSLNKPLYYIDSYIVYDKKTKVKYFLYICGDTSGITPLYNADGTLQIYED